MAEHSTIEWTDATWNPITGCTLVSEGCRHCYAATLAATRLKNLPSRKGLARINAAGEAKFTGEVRLNAEWIDQPLRWRRPRRIFVCAHGDLFHENVPDEWIDKVFAVMALASQHTFQVLTKRPARARAREYLDALQHPHREREIKDAGRKAGALVGDMPALGLRITALPLPNVWLGTSIEDQATADERVPELIFTPAAVRFLSCEPLLGSLRVDRLGPDRPVGWITDALRGLRWPDLDEGGSITSHTGSIDWVICGGESGPHARPMHPAWARSLRDQCQAAGVAFHFKQWGEWAPDDLPSELQESEEIAGRWDGVSHRVGKKRAGRLLDGREWNEMPGTT